MKRLIVLVLAVLLCFSLPQTAYGESVDALDLQVNMHSDYTAGLALGEFTKDTRESRYYGYISREPYKEVTEETVFEWGSVTKLLVWVSMMQLEEAGKIEFTDNINSYLPEDLHMEGQRGKTITLMDLMNHQAGFSDTLFLPEKKDEREVRSLEEALKAYRPQIIFEPGQVTSYSNYGAALAGYIVERVSGQDFADYVKQNIFVPLGMNRTALLPDRRDNPEVQTRRAANRSYIIMEDIDEELGDALSYIELYPAGSCTGTLEDFITFGQALLPGSEGSKKLFKDSDTVRKIFEPTSYYSGDRIPRNAHGFWYLPYGKGVWGHGGNTGGYSTTLTLDPKTGKGLVVMTNEAGETYFCYGLPERYFGSYSLWETEMTEDSQVLVHEDISGVYTNARAHYNKGYGRILKYMGSLMPIIKVKDEFVIPLVNTQVQKIRDRVYINHNNGLTALLVFHKDGSKKILEGYTSDFFREQPKALGLKAFIIILFLVVLVISLVRIFTGLWKKIKGKYASITVPLCALFVGLGVFVLLFSQDNFGPAQARLCTVLILVASLSTAYFAGQVYKKTGKYRMNLFTTAVVLVNVLYWQWFMIGI